MEYTPKIMSTTDLNLEPKEFGALLSDLAKQHTQILKLASEVYALPKGKKLLYPDGTQLGRKELKSLSSQHIRELKSLKKNYVAHGRRKPRTIRAGAPRKSALNDPIVVTPAMQSFIQNANLGFINPDDPSSGSLAEVLTAGSHGVTTRSILTLALDIYADVNGLKFDPENRARLRADALMNQHLGQSFSQLEAEPAKEKIDKKTGQTKLMPKFNRNDFLFNRNSSIVRANTVAGGDKLNAQQQARVAEVGGEQRLQQEQAVISETLARYRWIKGGRKGTFEAFRAAEEAKKAAKRAARTA